MTQALDRPEPAASASRSEKEHEHALVHLKALLAAQAGVIAATLCTVDGFEVASIALDQTQMVHGGKLAAISSSLQALCLAVVNELKLGPLESSTIEGQFGRTLTVEIPVGARSFVLSVVSAKPSLLALNLIATRDCAARIAASMAALPADRVTPAAKQTSNR